MKRAIGSIARRSVPTSIDYTTSCRSVGWKCLRTWDKARRSAFDERMGNPLSFGPTQHACGTRMRTLNGARPLRRARLSTLLKISRRRVFSVSIVTSLLSPILVVVISPSMMTYHIRTMISNIGHSSHRSSRRK